VTRRALAALAILALAACNKGSTGPAFRLSEPSSLAPFWGVSHKHPDILHPYVAVANTGQDELVLFDPVDNATVSAPIVIRPLSIPTPDPRPSLVASARFKLGDSPPAVDQPDLLVAVSAGGTSLQLIRTWASGHYSDPGLAVDASGQPLSVELGAQVLALQATPEVDAAGNLVADRAWVVAALVDGTLAVVEYQLTETADYGGPIAAVTGTATFQALGFEALSLAVDPSPSRVGAAPSAADAMQVSADQRSGGYPQNPSFLYAASLDPIAGNTYGVAQLDMRGTVGAWAVQAIDAHAPTRLVAAYTLRERQLSYHGGYVQENTPTVDDTGPAAEGGDFQDAAVSRVYAYLDPQSCGPRKLVACGVAVLDPAARDVLEDPWNPGQTPKRYLPPMSVVSEPLALVPGAPPARPPSTGSTQVFGTYPVMLVIAGGTRLSTGVLAMPSADGRFYFADLARWELPGNQYEVATFGVQTQVTIFSPSSSDSPQIALWRPEDTSGLLARYFASSSSAILDATSLARNYVRVTPGFTSDDLFSVTYQGYLPDFAGDRVAEVEDAGSGQLRVALQSGTGSVATQVVNAFDPAYGVRVGDIVQLRTTAAAGFPASTCPDVSQTDPFTGTYYNPLEGKVVSVDPPDANHPGGSLVLGAADCVPLKLGIDPTCESQTYGPWVSKPGCWAQLVGARLPVRIRAGGGGAPDDAGRVGKELVVIGTNTGYVGRVATVVGDGGGDPAFPAFSLDSTGEAALRDACAAACPGLLPYPSDWTKVPACDQAGRLACEAAAIAQRARRRHIVSAYCAQTDTTCNASFSFHDFQYPSQGLAGNASNGKQVGDPYPPPTGPAIAFSAGISTGTATATDLLVRDTQVLITTHAGYVPSSRYGAGTSYGAGSRPAGAVPFDRSADPGWKKGADGVRFYLPYVGNTVLDVSPSHYNSDTHVLR
jgi:hypothetical protein